MSSFFSLENFFVKSLRHTRNGCCLGTTQFEAPAFWGWSRQLEVLLKA